MKKQGFTLIELLVVISIIGLLSTIVLASVTRARLNAQYTKALAELNQMKNAMISAQGEQGRALIFITGNGCTDCVCRADQQNPACLAQLTVSLQAIENATNGVFPGLASNFTKDPWGSPYNLDENEREPIPPCSNGNDTLRTVGPDKVWGSGDDLILLIPFAMSC